MSISLTMNIQFRLGDIEEAIRKVKKFVCTKSDFVQTFIEEGLKFTSSLYLLLIWPRVLRFVFEKTDKLFSNARLFNFHLHLPENHFL